MEFKPIRATRIVETVVDRLQDAILDGTVAVGAKLPSEEQLAAQLGVGRRAVREALKVLETKGLVETQMGVGTVVCRNDLDNFMDSLARNVGSYLADHRAEAHNVMELRQLLEGAALARLGEEPDPETLERLAEAVDRQRQAHAAKDYHAYHVWHFRFHQQIVDALDNPVISMLYKQAMELVRQPMERSGSHPDRTEQSICDHEQMLQTLRGETAADPQELLRCHLQDFYVHVQDE